MSSYADQYNEQEMKALQSRINSVYNEANQIIQKEATAYFERFQDQYEKKQQLVQDGKLSKEDFQTWANNKMLYGKRYEVFRSNIADRLRDTNATATSMINQASGKVFSFNQNYTYCQIESSPQGAGVSFTLIDDRAVTRLLMNNSVELPKYYPKRAEVSPKAYTWDKQQISKTLSVALLTGQDVMQITKSLEHVTGSDRATALRNARTIMTGARAGGVQDGLSHAKEIGLDVLKEWNCSWVNSRQSHMDLDGVRVEENEDFPNGLKYPGDPGGTAAEVYNCQCFLAGAFRDSPKFKDVKKREYDEWKDKKISGGRTFISTGSRTQKEIDIRDAKAEKYYEEIVKNDNDVKAIASNTDFTESQIKQIKDHVFVNTHILDDGVRKFDSDYDMAVAWERLIQGTQEERDVVLLNRELQESIIEISNNATYRTAHEQAQRLFSWDEALRKTVGEDGENVDINELVKKRK